MGLSAVPAVETAVAEESTETEDEDEQQSDTADLSDPSNHLQIDQQQQLSEDQQWMRGSPPYSGRASSAPVGKVQVRVGDRIVGVSSISCRLGLRPIVQYEMEDRCVQSTAARLRRAPYEVEHFGDTYRLEGIPQAARRGVSDDQEETRESRN